MTCRRRLNTRRAVYRAEIDVRGRRERRATSTTATATTATANMTTMMMILLTIVVMMVIIRFHGCGRARLRHCRGRVLGTRRFDHSRGVRHRWRLAAAASTNHCRGGHNWLRWWTNIGGHDRTQRLT